MLVYVYLCVKDKEYKNFNCKSFEDFNKANKYFRENYKISDIKESTMIPVCLFTPFKKYVLQYKLSKIFSEVKFEE